MLKLEVLSFYRNKKTGGIYQVTKLAKHSETLEEMVVYEPAHPNGEVWVRPLEVFKAKFEGPLSEDVPF